MGDKRTVDIKRLFLEFTIWKTEMGADFTQGEFAKLNKVSNGRISQVQKQLFDSLKDFVEENDMDQEELLQVFEYLRKQYPELRPKKSED